MRQDLNIDVAGTGFAVLDLIYSGETKLAEGLGGSCANVLWSLAMLQRAVVPVLRLGADDVADELVSSFDQAGASTDYIDRMPGDRSPVLIQHLDLATGWHRFSSRRPGDHHRFPRYSPIGHEAVAKASDVFRRCSVFYTDRAAGAVVEAMEATRKAGGVVFFEPSAIGDEGLFRRAMAAATIVKFSDERMGQFLPYDLAEDVFLIVTMGVAGLRIQHGKAAIECGAVPARSVRDTSGSGDMVSVGVIDCLVARRASGHTVQLADVLHGARAGQRLAAANCSYVGARGIFIDEGADTARKVLSEQTS